MCPARFFASSGSRNSNNHLAGKRKEEPYENSGQTPAFKFTYQIKMVAGPFPQTDFTISEEETDFTPGYIGPGVSVSCYPIKDTLLTNEEANDVIHGKWAIYVFGRIDYIDAFEAVQPMS